MSLLSDIEGDFVKVGDFVKTEIGKIGGDAAKGETVLESAATIGDNVINAVKNFVASPEGQVLEDVIEAVPGIGPFAKDVLNLLPTIATDANWAVAEFTKSPQQVVIDGFTAAVGAPEEQKIINLAGAAGRVTTLVTTLLGVPATLQAAITVGQTVHAANATPAAATNQPLPPIDQVSQSQIASEQVVDNTPPLEAPGGNLFAAKPPVEGAAEIPNDQTS